LESGRGEEHQDASVDIFGRDAVGEIQERGEPVAFVMRPLSDGGGSVGPSEDAKDGDDENTGERMFLIDRGAGVFELIEGGEEILRIEIE
jgi:hypothetical protein